MSRLSHALLPLLLLLPPIHNGESLAEETAWRIPAAPPNSRATLPDGISIVLGNHQRNDFGKPAVIVLGGGDGDEAATFLDVRGYGEAPIAVFAKRNGSSDYKLLAVDDGQRSPAAGGRLALRTQISVVSGSPTHAHPHTFIPLSPLLCNE
jgi:hypothetical protein